tara:strand:+ start:437 stop:769 length:333 start_codon:yes stop_codon:yes gene_type:complete
MLPIDKADAILALRPNAQFRLLGDVLTWTDPILTEPTADEITAKYDELVAAQPLNELRMVRNIKLAETDWTQSRDITLSNDDAWRTYRQALRDITDSASSLDDVTWPEKP